MGWQDAAVVLIVAGAAIFLVRKVVLRPRRKPADAFVPLGQLKSKDKPGCGH